VCLADDIPNFGHFRTDLVVRNYADTPTRAHTNAQTRGDVDVEKGDAVVADEVCVCVCVGYRSRETYKWGCLLILCMLCVCLCSCG